MKRMTRLTALMTVLVMLPALGLAAVQSDTAIVFDTPIECERMLVESVAFTREGDTLLLEVVYTLPDTLSAEDREALELMRFNIMPDAESTEFPEGFQSGSVGIANGAPEWALVAGETYLQADTLDGWDAFPQEIYLRPYYKLLGVWGEVIVLSLAEAKAE